MSPFFRSRFPPPVPTLLLSLTPSPDVCGLGGRSYVSPVPPSSPPARPGRESPSISPFFNPPPLGWASLCSFSFPLAVSVVSEFVDLDDEESFPDSQNTRAGTATASPSAVSQTDGWILVSLLPPQLGFFRQKKWEPFLVFRYFRQISPHAVSPIFEKVPPRSVVWR